MGMKILGDIGSYGVIAVIGLIVLVLGTIIYRKMILAVEKERMQMLEEINKNANQAMMHDIEVLRQQGASDEIIGKVIAVHKPNMDELENTGMMTAFGVLLSAFTKGK